MKKKYECYNGHPLIRWKSNKEEPKCPVCGCKKIQEVKQQQK